MTSPLSTCNTSPHRSNEALRQLSPHLALRHKARPGQACRKDITKSAPTEADHEEARLGEEIIVVMPHSTYEATYCRSKDSSMPAPDAGRFAR